PEEIKKEIDKAQSTVLSQHSSIVMSDKAPAMAMAYDLAIGQCKSHVIEDGRFWRDLLHRADWRREYNPNPDTSEYYQTGRLNPRDIKPYMNKPDEILPKGEFEVVNDYGPRTRTHAARYPEIHNQEIPVYQWPMPSTLTEKELKRT
ncbi:effector protein Tle3 domain-containing protein, partial [Rahnella variigena]